MKLQLIICLGLYAVNVCAIVSVLSPFLNKFGGVLNSILGLKGIDVDIRRIDEIGILDGEYDFIVVGSGSAGSVIASRLSEMPHWKVLLLEVGKSESPFSNVPLFAPLMQWSEYNWAYVMEPQPNVCLAMEAKRCAWPRGRALGGSSVINYMIYMRGNRADYDKWAQLGNPGWSYDEVLPYFLKSEDVHLKNYDVNLHATGGPLTISDPYKSELTDAFLGAAKEIGSDIIDYNGERQTGFSAMQATIKRGRRHSVARAFLEPTKGRRNLHILTRAKVTKINFAGNTATGVNFVRKGKTYTVRASKEVIISAGALSSPQLLMLSGIGPKQHLQELGIPVLQDLPVGENLQDHIAYTGLTFLINRTVVEPASVIDPATILNWNQTGRGPFSSLGGIEAVGFIKTKHSREAGDNPDLELFFVGSGAMQSDYGIFNRKFQRISNEYYDKAFKPVENIPSWTVFPMLLHPKSKGFMKLRSRNPYHHPLFYGNYFTDPHGEDKAVLIEGIKIATKMARTKAFQKYDTKPSPILVPDCEHLVQDEDAYFSCALERFTITVHHQTGTCKMAPGRDGVVDHRLKVHGFERLRVADTSVIPNSIAAHTNAPAIMIGEKAADIIKNEWANAL